MEWHYYLINGLVVVSNEELISDSHGLYFALNAWVTKQLDNTYTGKRGDVTFTSDKLVCKQKVGS